MSNDEIRDIFTKVESLEGSGFFLFFLLLLKGVSEAIQNEAKEQNRGFHSISLHMYIRCKLIR